MNVNLNTQDYWLQLREGNTLALSALYQLHYIGLINYGVKLTGDRDLANDCFTAVLLDLWEKRHALPEVSNVRSYLLTCLHRRIFHEIESGRRRDRTHALATEALDAKESSHEEYLAAIEGNDAFTQVFMSAFQRLTLRQQQLLRMKFFENLDYDHIATTCGITKRTAYNIIHDALRQLKHELKGHEQASRLPIETLLSLSLILIFS